MSAGTVFTGLHRGPDVWDATWAHVSDIAALTQAMGAEHLVVIPSFWRDDKTGEVLEPDTLTAEQWRHLTTQTERLGHEVRERYGLKIVVHPHADTHIDSEENVTRFLDGTDSSLVSLCLDTGHYAYCGGDSVKLIETYGERIGYLHLKQVDPEILADVRANEVPFGPAVARGVMCEPPSGVPALEPVLAAAQKLDVELFAIVEQDMYPCEPDKPLPDRSAHAGVPEVLRGVNRLRAGGGGCARAAEPHVSRPAPLKGAPGANASPVSQKTPSCHTCRVYAGLASHPGDRRYRAVTLCRSPGTGFVIASAVPGSPDGRPSAAAVARAGRCNS